MRWLAVLVLSLMGLGIAVPFTLAYYGRVAPTRVGLPEELCRTGEGKCMSVLGTPDARVFGPPNSLLGVFYYVVLAAVAGAGLAGVAVGWWRVASAVVAWGTVALAVYLTWSLFFRLRQPCRLCLTAHAINLALALLLTAR